MKNYSSLTKNSSLAIIFALLFLVAVFQKNYDDFSPPFTTRIKLAKRNLLPPQILPYISFGFTNMITDYYWISAIQDFVAWNKKEGFYIGYFRNITTLDPKFEYPYLFSILTIPNKKDITTLDTVAGVALKGMEAIPSSWQIPFYLGTQYYLFTGAYEPAEEYLKAAAGVKGAPDGVYLVYSTFVGKGLFTKEQKMGFAKKLVQTIYNNTDNEIIKKLAAKGIQETFVTQLLEKGILAYKTKYKRYPKNVNEMIAVNFIALPQDFLDDFTVDISPQDGSFKIVEMERE
jgi:hypothetical protein